MLLLYFESNSVHCLYHQPSLALLLVESSSVIVTITVPVAVEPPDAVKVTVAVSSSLSAS